VTAPPLARLAITLALAAGLSSVATADVYRCTEAGKTVYSDQPCQGAASATVSVPARSADPRVTSPQSEANMGRIAVGQTPLQVEMAWGRPKGRNIDTGAAGRTEQWVYDRQDGTAYVYFRGGLVSSVSVRSEAPGATAVAVPVTIQPTRDELSGNERAAKAAERRFIRDGMGSGDVLKRLGEPDSRSLAGLQECWYYAATRLDPQTNTTICFDLSGSVFNVDRRVAR
jgi:hypothetical protein